MRRFLTALLVAGLPLLGLAQNPATGVQLNLTTNKYQTTSGVVLGAAYNVRVYGAKGDGVTNDSAAVNAAIQAVSAGGGGNLVFPPGNYLGNFILAAGVHLIGAPGEMNVSNAGVTLTAAATGAVVDTPIGNIGNVAVVGFNLQGLGSGTAGKGVYFRNVNYGAVQDCAFNNFADQAIEWDTGVACRFIDLQAQNCLLNRTRSGQDGVIDVTGGTDGFFERIEATASVTSSKTSGMDCNALYIGGANHFLVSCIGEISDRGFYYSGSLCRFSNCRADLNMMQGFYTTGSDGQFSNCLALDDSEDTTNTYSGFYIAANTSQGNLFSNCLIQNLHPNVVKYGFEDYSQYTAIGARSIYDASCRALSYGTAAFLMQSPQGGGFVPPSSCTVDAQTGSVTVDVTGTSALILGTSGSETITNFIGATPGTVLNVNGNAGVTIKNGTNIFTSTGADKTLAANKAYHFFYTGSVWNEITN